MEAKRETLVTTTTGWRNGKEIRCHCHFEKAVEGQSSSRDALTQTRL
jgi:hypothetical protein